MSFIRQLRSEIISVLKNRDIIVLLTIGPIFLTLLFGGVYVNSYVNDIPVAILDEDNSVISRMIVQQFNENERFDVIDYPQSKEELDLLIGAREVYMGIYIPKGFQKDVQMSASPQVLLITDGTNVVIANNCYAAAAGIIQTVAAMSQIKLLEAKGVVPQAAKNMALVFNYSDRTLYDPRMTYLNYLLLGFVSVFFQQVMLSGIGISLIKDGNEIVRGNVLNRLIIKILGCSFYALSSTYIAIIITNRVFNIPLRGNIFIAIGYCIIFAFAISCPSIILASLLKDKLKLTQIAYMLSLPTFVSSGYVWPSDQMPAALVILIKLVWPLIYFSRPFDELLFKGNFSYVDAAGLCMYTLIWFPIAVKVFKAKFKPEFDRRDIVKDIK